MLLWFLILVIRFCRQLLNDIGCTFVEYYNMHLMYGLARCNSLKGQRLYAERFPNRQLPNSNTFQRINQRLQETSKKSLLSHFE